MCLVSEMNFTEYTKRRLLKAKLCFTLTQISKIYSFFLVISLHFNQDLLMINALCIEKDSIKISVNVNELLLSALGFKLCVVF